MEKIRIGEKQSKIAKDLNLTKLIISRTISYFNRRGTLEGVPKNGSHQDCLKGHLDDWKCKSCSYCSSQRDLFEEMQKMSKSLVEMKTEMGKSIEFCQGSIEESNSLIKKQDKKISECLDKIETLQNKCIQLEKENIALKSLLNDEEQHSRSNSVEIVGVPELGDENVISC